MEKNLCFNEKTSFSSRIKMPTIKLKSLNFLKKRPLKKKSSRILLLDNNFLLKSDEKIPKISNSLINIFYRNSKKIRNKDTNIKTNNNILLPLTNNNTTKANNKNSDNDSFTQNEMKSTIIQNKNPKYYSFFSKRKKYFTDFINNKKDFDYKKRLKRINSSFSPESNYSFDKKLLKNFSFNNILYNSTLFSNNKTTNRNNLYRTKIKLSYKKSFFKDKININGKIFPNRKLYRFTSDLHAYEKIVDLKKLSEKYSKKEKKYEEDLENENKNIFNKFYSIIDRIRFKKKYQNPFIYDKNDFKNKNKEEYNNLINPKVFQSHLKLLKEINEKIRENKGLEKTNIEKTNNKKLEKYKNMILRIYLYFKQRNISNDEFKLFKKIKKSFTYKKTKSLIDSIKLKYINLCSEIIEANKYLVFDYDNFHLTPLHWAVKKNLYEFIPKLINYGSIVDSINFSGESPLHIAVKNNFYDSTCILLYYLASPFLKDKNGKRPIEYSKNYDMKNLLEKVMKIHYLSFFQRTINQQKFIKTQFLNFIKEEFENKIKVFTFYFFKEKELLET